jgi:phosphate transport system substrate-binding protein
MRVLAIVAVLLGSMLGARAADENKIVSIGSDTMSHLMKNTAEAFKAKHPEVTVEIQDPGSSAGVGAMINGQSDLCPSSRSMKPEEYDKFAEAQGKGFKPIELRVALDGIVIYVHHDNPINQLSMEQIGRIFAENPAEDITDSKGKTFKAIGSKIKTWGEVDPNLPAEWKNAKITLYSRNAASGTYAFFKEHALNSHDYDKAAQEMPGTSSVVNGVAKDKYAIGYGGIGYKTQDVKLVPVAAKTGEPAVPATIETVVQKKYPISRALQIYVPKKPKGLLKEYLAFILSKEGQDIIGSEKVGFVPLPPELAAREAEKLTK